MQAQEKATRMFGQLTFEVSTEALRNKFVAKAIALKKKVEVRKHDIEKLRKDHEIDDAALIDILGQARDALKAQRHVNSFSYVSTRLVEGTQATVTQETRHVSAGVVSHLLAEQDFMKAEMNDAARCELLARNIGKYHPSADNDDTRDYHTVTIEELDYLGF